MDPTNMKLVIPPTLDGQPLVIGSPHDFDQVRKAQKYEDRTQRVFTAISDLAAYLIRWGTPENTTVFCSQSDIKAILDERTPINTAAFKVAFSTAFEQWRQAFSKGFTQAEFKEFVERRQADIVDGIRLLNVVADLKLTTTIEHSGQHDNDHNYQVIFKESTGGESAVKIPKSFQLQIPLTSGHDDPLYTLDVELKLKKPKNADEKFLFTIKCHGLEDVLNHAMEDRIAKLKELMEGWQIYAGLPGNT